MASLSEKDTDFDMSLLPEQIAAESITESKKGDTYVNDSFRANANSFLAVLQPSEDRYYFETLDKIMEFVRKNGLKVCMATLTGAHPAWMAKKHPDILRTDFNGIKRKFGGRHNSCPNSPSYRKYAAKLAGLLAKRYKDYENIVAWHISNEFGGECYCENCEQAFRKWLKHKFKTVEEMNRAFNTTFWGHTFYDWDEVVLPNLQSEHFLSNGEDRTMFQGITLEYRRFMSESMLECFRLEYQEIKKEMPDIPVTINLMGFYKPLDYQKLSSVVHIAISQHFHGIAAEILYPGHNRDRECRRSDTIRCNGSGKQV